MYVFGGQNETEGLVFNTSYILNPVNKFWSINSSLPEPRHSATCVLYNGIALIYGGANEDGVLDSLLLFDPGKN